MRLATGMYARLYRKSTDETIIVKVKDLNDKGFYNSSWVKTINASFNIIDLIEAGDYVNGSRVETVDACDDILWIEEDNLMLENQDIKSVATKEQFKSCEYKVEG